VEQQTSKIPCAFMHGCVGGKDRRDKESQSEAAAAAVNESGGRVWVVVKYTVTVGNTVIEAPTCLICKP
jgi:hypothetical protein